jgi:hypothetical protein
MVDPAYVASMPDARAYPTRGFESAYVELIQTLQTSVLGLDVQQRLQAAYADYIRLMQAALAGEQVQQHAADAYSIYMHALQDALSSAPQRQRSTEAFRRYLRSVARAWAEIDPDTLEAPVVAAIAQSMLSAAWAVGGTTGLTPTMPAATSTAARDDQTSDRDGRVGGASGSPDR